MKRLIIVPSGWPCKLAECSPGFFLWQDMNTELYHASLCFKSEYGDVFNEAGECFWGGTTSKEARADIMVQPCDWEWEEA